MPRSKNRMAAALQVPQLRVVDDASIDLQSPAAAHFDSWDSPRGGWQNQVTGFGTSSDKTAYNRFVPTALMNVEELSAIYHGEDLAARIIDIVPDEMLREGFSVDVGDPALNALVSEKFEALAIDDKLADGIRWGRLFGGGAILIGADDGRSAATPLAIERVESLSYLYVFDRRYMVPLTWYRDAGNPKLGQAETYMVLSPSSYTDTPMAIVHESRLVMFGGASTAARERQLNMGWDLSILQRPAKVLGDFNIGWNAASVLLQDGNQAVFSMSGLAETLAAGGEAALMKRLKQVNFGRSVINATIVDAGTAADSGGDPAESFTRQQFPMTGIPEMLDRFMLRLASAAQIPATILMGQSPAGMNATGQSDFQWFYDRVKAQQTLKLAPKIRRIVKLLLSTKEFRGGSKVADKIATKFPPLWTEPPLTRAQTRKTLLEGDAIAITNGMLVPAEVSTARFTSGEGFETEIQLSDEGKKARVAELAADLDDLTNPPDDEAPPTPGAGGGFGGGAPKAPFARSDSDDQPREENGQFASTGGGGGSGGGSGKGGGRPERAARASARLVTAKSKLQEAKGALDTAKAEHESVANEVHQEVAAFREQDAKDQVRAHELATQLRTEHAAAKTEAKQLGQQVDQLVDAHDHGVVIQRAVLRIHELHADERYYEKQLADNAEHMKNPELLHSRDILEKNRQLDHAALEKVRQEAVRAEQEHAPLLAKISPQERALITREADVSQRLEELTDAKRTVESAIKNAPKHAALVDQIEGAAKAGDVASVVKLGRKLESAKTVRNALSGLDQAEVDAGLKASIYDRAPGIDHAALTSYRETVRDSAQSVASAKSKLARAERAVRVHEREVKRLSKAG